MYSIPTYTVGGCLMHSAKGTEWGKHKYIDKIRKGGKWIYTYAKNTKNYKKNKAAHDRHVESNRKLENQKNKSEITLNTAKNKLENDRSKLTDLFTYKPGPNNAENWGNAKAKEGILNNIVDDHKNIQRVEKSLSNYDKSIEEHKKGIDDTYSKMLNSMQYDTSKLKSNIANKVSSVLAKFSEISNETKEKLKKEIADEVSDVTADIIDQTIEKAIEEKKAR